MSLSEINKHERDCRISFNEPTHTYAIDGSSESIISVTTLIHNQFSKFDSGNVIKKMRQNPNFLSGKYGSMTDHQIMDLWENEKNSASKAGTEMHKKIELYYNDEEVVPDSKEFEYFLDFDETIKGRLTPYRTEWSIFIEDLKLAGQLDILYKIDGTENFALYDWKRSKEIKYSNDYQKGLGCCKHLDDCNYIHYSIQLNIYRYILKKFYNINVTEMFLVVLHPNNNTYKLVEVKLMEEEVERILEERRRGLL